MASYIWQRTTQIAREETQCRHVGYSFRLAGRVLLYASSHRQTTAFVTPVVEHWLERERAQWVHHEGSIWRCILNTSYHKRTVYHGVKGSPLTLYNSSILNRMAAQGTMGRRIDPSWWTHWAIYPVCGIVHIKDPLMLIGKSSTCSGGRYLRVIYYMSDAIKP